MSKDVVVSDTHELYPPNPSNDEPRVYGPYRMGNGGGNNGNGGGNYEQPYEPQRKKSKFGMFVKLIVYLLILLLLYLAGSFLWDKTIVDKGFSSKDAKEVIYQQENPVLKADKVNPNKAYSISDAFDTLNQDSVTVERIQFRTDQTRLWVNFKNTGTNKIHMMPNINSTLIDNKGNTYNVDSFSGQQGLQTGLPPGTSQTVMFVFPPIKAEATQLNFFINGIFDMKAPGSWQYNIPFQIP